MRNQHTFLNQDLVLQVSPSVDPAHFDINLYEPFLDALCSTREYQKEAIRVTLRYLLGGRYDHLRALAEENFNSNEKLQERYGSFKEMEHYLQLPDQLSCSLDLATATGKSYVMYGISRIMLAEGAVDRVLVLCPSVTIEEGLMQKFRALSADITLKDLLPKDACIRNPHIINATESIVEGTICIENFHATLEHVKSSVRDSLAGKGEHTLVLNDEVHHVYNKPIGRTKAARGLKKWKEFLLDPEFGFHYLVGGSGTCYIGNDYFADVVYRYSLREAIEGGFVKTIDYVAEDASQSQYEKFQKIYDNHLENQTARYRKVKPLTILVTRDISTCKHLTEDLIEFLAEREGISHEDADKKVLIVTSAREHEANVRALADVDRPDTSVEWITSVSMLTEGWDVQNVFHIVPHEERAFNSKLLIAQVLGRGLRVPDAYRGEWPVVTVFNHDAWSSRIKHLVDEVMEVEKRLYSYPVTKECDYNFALHHIDYSKTQMVEEFEQTGEYDFSKGFVKLISQVPALERETTYERAVSGNRRTKKTLVRYKMYTVDQVAEDIHNKYGAIDMEKEGKTAFEQKYPLEWIKDLIHESLKRVGETEDRVSADNKQRILAAFGVTMRGAAKRVRYQMTPKVVETLNTVDRPRDSVGFASLRRGDVRVFWDEFSKPLSDKEVQKHLQEALDDWELERSLFEVSNAYLFRTSLNIVIANHEPEYRFIRTLLRQENATVIDAWIKSTDRGFYPIEYAWRKGEHPKRGYFNPDFFIKKDNHILVIEIKGDEEIDEPSRENKGKYKYARQHFETLNQQQSECTYSFHFLTPCEYDKFFKFLRDGNYASFVSELDAELEGNGISS
jgi:type III restriction enzyme